MRLGPKISSGLIIVVWLFAFLFAANLSAAEYNYAFNFEKPTITELYDGRQLVELAGARQKDDVVGAPILPVKKVKLFIPANENVVSIDIDFGTLKSIEGSYQIQHVTTPYPLSFQGQVSVDKPAASIYETNGFYPSTVYKSMGLQFLYGVKILLVDLMPVLYNPADGHLKYYRSLHVKVITVERQRMDQEMPFTYSIENRKKILRIIENHDDFLSHHPETERDGSKRALLMAEGLSSEDTRQYVIITTRDLAPAFQILANHRAAPEGGGYTTHIEYIDDIDVRYAGIDLAEKMRNFIREMYTNHETQYVLLGGDSDGSPEHQVIPTRLVYAQAGGFTDYQIPSDLYFACLDGSWNGDGDEIWGELNDGVDGGDIDWFSEVYVGRIAADDLAEANNQINKIIAFETSNHASKTLLVGEALADATWGGDRLDWVYAYMGSTPKTELYDRDWGNNKWPISQLLAYLNSNKYFWINNLGHSTVVYNMGMNYNDIASLNNNNFMFVYAQGCYSGSIDSFNSEGSFESVDCFGEAITNRYADRGAFAYIGNSRYSWYTPGSYVEGASNRAHKEFVEAVFNENITKLGEANQISKTDLPLGSGLYRWIAFETNLLGCPASDLSIQYALDTDCIDCDSNEEIPDGDGGDGDGDTGCFVESLR